MMMMKRMEMKNGRLLEVMRPDRAWLGTYVSICSTTHQSRRNYPTVGYIPRPIASCSDY